MRKLLVISLLVCVQSLLAGPVSQQQARERAARFIEKTTGHRQALSAARCNAQRALGREAAFYVFNIGESQGYVIASADDREPAILGYTDNGSFVEDQLPPQLQLLLSRYAETHETISVYTDAQASAQRAEGDDDGKTDTPATEGRKAIAPLIEQEWNQGTPYNYYCPQVGTESTVTGCVATALAQIMAYHRWPAATTDVIPAYTTTTRQIEIPQIEAGVPIAWDLMRPSYTQEAVTDTAQKAVAQLVYLCAVAAQMDFNLSRLGGSGAPSDAPLRVLPRYFDYDPNSIRQLDRKDYSYDEWQEVIYRELESLRPIMVSGRGRGGGHSFLLDGYAEDDLFHINWGWGGLSNGNYHLNLLTPQSQGAGGTSADGYNVGQTIVVGIQRNEGATPARPNVMTVQQMKPLIRRFTRKDSTEPFVLNGLRSSLWNLTGVRDTFDVALRMVDTKDSIVAEQTVLENRAFQTSQGRKDFAYPDMTIPATVEAGDYRLLVVSKPHSYEEWQLCNQAMGNQVYLNIEQDTLVVKSYELRIVAQSVTEDATLDDVVNVSVTIKNVGEAPLRSDLYFKLNPRMTVDREEVDAYEPIAFLDLEPGNSSDVAFEVMPKNTGEQFIVFETTSDGEIMADTLHFYVRQGPELVVLSDSIYFSNRELGTIEGDTFKLELVIENQGESVYVGQLEAQVIVRNAVDNGLYQLSNYDQAYDVVLPVGERYTLEKVFKKPYDRDGYQWSTYYVRIIKDSRVWWNTGTYTFVEPDGIALPTQTTGNGEAVYYDLQGRRVMRPGRGVYISEGRKVVVK